MDEYRVSVDLGRALVGAVKARRGAIAAAITQELTAAPSGRVSIAAWVTGPGYVGKIESAVPGSGLGTASFWFLSYTKPYTGTVPPASLIAPFAPAGRSLWAVATGS
jgi:hypothetical protein